MPDFEFPDGLGTPEIPDLASSGGMFAPENLIPMILFSLIGFVAFSYGKSTKKVRPLLVGIGLMVYSYFYSDPWYLWGGGIALTVALMIWREE